MTKQQIFNIITVFILMYIITSFVAWDIDCRKWDILGRYAVILVTAVYGILIKIYEKK